MYLGRICLMCKQFVFAIVKRPCIEFKFEPPFCSSNHNQSSRVYYFSTSIRINHNRKSLRMTAFNGIDMLDKHST